MQLPKGSQLPSLWQTFSIIADPIGFLDRCFHEYGETFTLRVLGVNSPPVIFLSRPDSIQAVFTTLADRFELGKVTHVFRPLVGSESLIMQDGDRHQNQRQMLMPALHGERLHSWGQLIAEITAETIAAWQPGQAIDIRAWMSEISLEIILRVVFGMELGDRYTQLKPLLHDLLESVTSTLYSVQFFLPPLQQDLGAWSPWGKFVRHRGAIDALLYAEIAERRSQSLPTVREPRSTRTDILSMLMTAEDVAGQPLSDVEIRDQLMTLLLLGHETTASALAWAFYWLHHSPNHTSSDSTAIDPNDSQQNSLPLSALHRSKLQQELTAIEAQSGLEIDPVQLAQLPYLSAICKESLRVYPIALISQPRKVKATVHLEGYELPPGSIVIPCIYTAHRRADTYPQPYEFRPDRFLAHKFSPYEYLPFGGGTRSCIGMALALFEMKLILATILRHYEFQPVVTSNQPIRPQRRGITFVPPASFCLTVKTKRAC